MSDYFRGHNFERDKRGLFVVVKWLFIIVLSLLFLAFVQTVYLVNFDKAVRNCVKTQNLTLIQCKNLAK